MSLSFEKRVVDSHTAAAEVYIHVYVPPVCKPCKVSMYSPTWQHSSARQCHRECSTQSMAFSIKQQPWLLYRDAQDNGEYARAFWLCAECCRSMENVASLKVAQQLNATINQLYEETIQRLEAALQSVCNDFHSKQYLKVRPTHNRADGSETHNQGWASFLLSCICPILRYDVARHYMLIRWGMHSMYSSVSSAMCPPSSVALLSPVFRYLFAVILRYGAALRLAQQDIVQ